MSHTLNFVSAFLKHCKGSEDICPYCVYFKMGQVMAICSQTGSTSEIFIVDLVSNDYVEFYAVSVWYRKLFDTEKAVPPKKTIFVRKRRY